MKYLLYGIGFLLLAVVATRVMAYRRLRAMALRAAGFSVAAADEVPPSLRSELEQRITDLLPLGFQARGFARATSLDADDDRPQWNALAQHSQYGSWALVSAHPLPEAELPLVTAFYSPLAGGRLLMSSECVSHLMIAGYADTIHLDQGLADPAASWRHHLSELLRHPSQAPPLADAQELMARLQLQSDGYLPMLRLQGQVSDGSAGRVFPAPLAAWRWVGRIQRGEAALVQARAKLRRQAADQRLVPAAIEADAVVRMEHLTERRSLGGSSPLLFLLSLIAFIAAALLSDGYGSYLALIVAILLFHELGHFLAMRACGYKNTAIFFLPLFGAAASGRKSDATIPEQVLVSLMGPLPGILLGLALLGAAHADRHSLLFMAGSFLVVINLFNLLPILPFDGGQIVSRLLFGSRPWLDFIFRSIAVVAMLAMGLAFAPILIYVGIFLALGLIAQRKIAQLRSWIMRTPEIMRLTGDRLLEAVSAVVAQDPASRTASFANRLVMVRDICTALNRPVIPPGTSIALFAAYIGSCAIAPTAVIIFNALTR